MENFLLVIFGKIPCIIVKYHKIIINVCLFKENVFTIKSWCKTNFGIEENTLNTQFNIPEDLDYI